MSGYVPAVGEKVSINGEIVEVFHYSEDFDQIIYLRSTGASKESVDRVTAHVTNTHITPLNDSQQLVTAAGDVLPEQAHNPAQWVSNGSPEETEAEGAERTTTADAEAVRNVGPAVTTNEPAGDAKTVAAVEEPEGE